MKLNCRLQSYRLISHPVSIFYSPVLCGAPPAVDNAFLIGRKRSHYDIHSVVRYQCADGFLQRHVPTAKCRANGKWDRPKIICIKCEFLNWILLEAPWPLIPICLVIFTFFLTFSKIKLLLLAALGSTCHRAHSGLPSPLSLLIGSKKITVVAV